MPRATTPAAEQKAVRAQLAEALRGLRDAQPVMLRLDPGLPFQDLDEAQE